MKFDWKQIVTMLVTAMAGMGGPWALIAALIQDYLLPLVKTNEKLALKAAATEGVGVGAAPDEFKTAVRDKLLALIAGMSGHPFIKFLLSRFVGQISDTLLDTVYDLVTGKESAMKAPAPMSAAESTADPLAACALEYMASN